MAGVVTGSIDHRIGDGILAANELNQELFTVLYNWLNSKYTRIASQFGSGGTGFDFHDGANPSGNNAFAVFRAASAVDPFDILIQWADNDPFGNAPGNPGELAGGNFDGVGIAIAARLDGTDPWGGGTVDAGGDSKTSPVWTPGGSTLYNLDVANSPSGPGSFNTNKENCILIHDYASTGGISRLHVVGDDDGFMILSSFGDNGGYVGKYFGAYTPRANLTVPLPLVAISSASALFWALGEANVYGTNPGNGSLEGGLLGAKSATDLVRPMSLSVATQGSSETYAQPSGQTTNPEYEAERISLLQRQTNQGLCGYLPEAVVQNVFAASNHSVNSGATRAFMADTTVTTRKWSIPWDGGAPPGTNNTRAGRQF